MEIKDLIKKTEDDISVLTTEIDKLKNSYTEKIKELSRIHKVDLDSEEFKNFLKKCWAVLPKGKNEYYVAVPKFVDFQIGWLDHTDKAWNYFIINKFTQWLGEIPNWMRSEFGFKIPDKVYVTDGVLSFEEGMEQVIKDKYGDLVTSVGQGKARIKTGSEFDLIAEIIDNGSLSFLPSAVQQKDLRETKLNFTLSGKYGFQKEAYDTFLKYGAVGIYWMTGAGKSFFSMHVLDSLKGPKLLVVPTKTLEEQWKEYFKEYAPRLVDEVEVIIYYSYHKIKEKEYVITVFDEVQRLPADIFSRFATIKTKYRLGLSASPFREDGRTNYIFALTGYPMGLDWKSMVKILGLSYHEVNVYILKNQTEKMNKIKALTDFDKKTLIYSDGIELGKKIASTLNIPFIYGATKDRLEKIKENNIIAVSRVGDLGISIKGLEHIIEADFLFGSCGQELQRSGRLFHSYAKIKVHDILFTEEEFYAYQKRLHSLVEKGFKINIQSSIPRTLAEIEENSMPTIRRPVRIPVAKKFKQEIRVRQTEEQRAITKGFVEKKIKEMTKLINTVSPFQRRILKFLIIARQEFPGKIAYALGVKDDKIKEEIKNLEKLGLVKVAGHHGYAYNVPKKVAEDLKVFKATSEDMRQATDEIEKIIQSWED